MRRQVILASAGALLLVACSGDDDAAPSTSAEVTTTTSAAAPSTDPTPAPTTSQPAATVPPTTSQATTTVPESTAPPTSDQPVTTAPDDVPPRVTFPDDPEKQAVVDAAYAFYDAANAAARDPSDSGLREVLATTSAEPIETRIFRFLDGLAERGERVVGQPETRLEIYEFSVEISGASGTFDACSVDTDFRVETREDGDVIVDDSVTSWNQTYQLVRVEDEWRVSDIVRFATFEGEVGCGDH